MQIRRLVPSDVGPYHALRLRALLESPSSFSSSYEEECDAPLDAVAELLAEAPGRAVFGALLAAQLVGMVGIAREGRRKMRHKGFLRGVYVAPQQRGAGAGKRLVEEALSFAAGMGGVRQINLSV
ncbi:MAG: GNAT family N-acetyltransferase, partial [Steroidobacteraceae bacterium]